MQREGLDLPQPSLTLLAQLSQGLSAGQLQAFAGQLAARMHDGVQGAGSSGGGGGASPGAAAGASSTAAGAQCQPKRQPPALLDAALELLPAFAPLPADEAAALREWTARVHEPLEPEEDAGEGGKKAGAKGKKK